MPENAMDYYGADGLLYCGKCQTPKEALFPNGLVLMGKEQASGRMCLSQSRTGAAGGNC